MRGLALGSLMRLSAATRGKFVAYIEVVNRTQRPVGVSVMIGGSRIDMTHEQ
jgi:hypothetical protein